MNDKMVKLCTTVQQIMTGLRPTETEGDTLDTSVFVMRVVYGLFMARKGPQSAFTQRGAHLALLYSSDPLLLIQGVPARKNSNCFTDTIRIWS